MSFDTAKLQLILELRSAGIQDDRVLSAIERTPRELFVPAPFREHAWNNAALPIRQGQTISQPYVVAYMTEALEVGDRHKVLEIGTGSGYQTAILARLARRVFTIERYASLAREAQAVLHELRITNVVSIVGDGHKGWPEQAPFDRIIVTAAPLDVPAALVDQLADGGVLVCPVGPEGGDQHLVRIVRHGDQVRREDMLPVRFVPLREGVARNA